METYCVNKNAQSNGDHEVHVVARCTSPRLPLPENRQHLGEFSSCAPAVIEAKRYYEQSDGCWYCSRPCHAG